jgi:hypothetical protein
VDLEAFRNLVDAGEEDFLRANLSRREFRAVQRERTRAAVEYIRNSAHNAACLLRLGEAASRSGDPRIADAGRRLIDSALRLRAYALLSNTRLYVRLVFPESRLSQGKLPDNYQHLSILAINSLSCSTCPGNRLSTLLKTQKLVLKTESTAHQTQGVVPVFWKQNKREKAFTG